MNLAGVATTGADVRDETIGDLSRPLPASSEASRRGAYLAALVLLALREDPATRDGLAGAYLAYGPYDQSLTPSCRDYGDRNLVTSTQAEEWFRARAVLPPDWTPSSAETLPYRLCTPS